MNKYLQLAEDIQEAKRDAWEMVSNMADDGMANMDACVIHLPRWRIDKINANSELVFKKSQGGEFFISGSFGCANRNAEYQLQVSRNLSARGYDTYVFYRLD